ncbi:hypothetical protein [Streptacidiphilus sp. EB129]|uniref:DUF6919 domain-containing protein n=1 Tax=Streptacidiphilus sp. EB129 TaxID=3156262 RepID=UPI003512AFA9
MKRSERRLWRSAATVQDLADLMARWLEGDIGSQPGYQPRCGPDPETADLIETLAACNRAGYLTIGSQPGLITDDVRQRAGVEGFTTDVRLMCRMSRLAESAGLLTALHVNGKSFETADGYIVTLDQGRPFTTFGRPLDHGDLALILRGCHPAAVDAVTGAYQFAVVDPEYGRSDRLQALLDEATGRSGPICADCGCTEHTPCLGGCWWMSSPLVDLCSTCYESPASVYLTQEAGPEYLDEVDFGDADDYDGVENECENCGAPYYHSGCDGPFCTWDCAEVGAEAAAYAPPVDLVKRQLQPQPWGWAVGEEPPF